jgi:xanthine dehydrogenase accessory factor
MSVFDQFRRCLEEQRGVALATVIAGTRSVGRKLLVQRDGTTAAGFGVTELNRQVSADAMRLLVAEQPDTMHYDLPLGEFDVFIDVYPAPRQVIIVGASHAAGPLTRLARMLGYSVIVTDARAAFAQSDRYPEADSVIKGWPQDVLPSLRCDESTYLVLLSHDPKFDEPTLHHALRTPIPYIGAIGSRKTQRERFERLRGQGYTEEQLARIYGPVGLDLGSVTPEETALAILAEITAVRHGRDGGFLRRPRQ